MRESLREELREGFEEYLEKTEPAITEPLTEPVTKEISVQDEIKSELILVANIISDSSLLLGISLGLYLPPLAKYILGSTLLLPTLILVKNSHWFRIEDKEKWISLLSLVTLSGILNAYLISKNLIL